MYHCKSFASPSALRCILAYLQRAKDTWGEGIAGLTLRHTTGTMHRLLKTQSLRSPEPVMIASGVQHNISTSEFNAVANRLLALALTQHSTAEFLQETLQEALRITGGLRAFVARIEQES